MRIMHRLVLALIAALTFAILTCSEKATDSNSDGPAPGVTWQEVFAFQSQVGELFESYLSSNDTSTAIQMALSAIRNNTDVVQWAVPNSQGIAIKYKNGRNGGILVDPEDMAGVHSSPSLSPAMDTATALFPEGTPRTRKSVFLCPVYSERKAYADSIISVANSGIAKSGFENLHEFLDEESGVDEFASLDGYGLIHIYSHSYAFPAKDSLEELYVMTGDTVVTSLVNKYGDDFREGRLIAVYVPGKGNTVFMGPGFFSIKNNLSQELSIVYLGFGFGFLSGWQIETRFAAGAGVCIGYDWRVNANHNLDWASEFYQVMTDTSSFSHVTVEEWHDDIVSSYVDSLDTTPPLPRVSSINFHGLSDMSMWMALRVTNVTPAHGTPGATVTIEGIGFGDSQSGGSVSFGGVVAEVMHWSNTSIVAVVPQNAQTGEINITTDFGELSDQLVFYIFDITGISPNEVIYGDTLTITGYGFGDGSGESYVSIHEETAETVSWSDTLVKAVVPDRIISSPVYVYVNGYKSSGVDLSVFGITGVIPSGGSYGDIIEIKGSGFNRCGQEGVVSFNGKNASEIEDWKENSIKVRVPQGVSSGEIVVSACELQTAGYLWKVVAIDQLSPAWGGPGATVEIRGTGFEPTVDEVILVESGLRADIVSWDDTLIVITIPEDAASGTLRVSANGILTNAVDLNIMAVQSLVPDLGVPGDTISVEGVAFLDYKITNRVTFNGLDGTVVYWSDTLVNVIVPDNVTSGDLVLHVLNSQSAGKHFTAYGITKMTPSWGGENSAVSISGIGFGNTQGEVHFAGTSSSSIISSWNNELIETIVPEGAVSGPVSVISGGNESLGKHFDVLRIERLQPPRGYSGDTIGIVGDGFLDYKVTDSVIFGSDLGTITYWSDTMITAIVPDISSSCDVTLHVNNIISNSIGFEHYQTPVLESISPGFGTYGTEVTLGGYNFSDNRDNRKVLFEGIEAEIVTWSETSITAKIPNDCVAGSVVINALGRNSNSLPFSVFGIMELFPSWGTPGDTLTISGTGFGADQGSGSVSLNGSGLQVLTWSDDAIDIILGEGASSGDLTVNIGGYQSNPSHVEILVTPTIKSIQPDWGPWGSTISILGRNLGDIPGLVFFTGKSSPVTPADWSQDGVAVEVPEDSKSGAVKLLIGDSFTNEIAFDVFRVDSVVPVIASEGDTISVYGESFLDSSSAEGIMFSDIPGEMVEWTDTRVSAIVPSGAETGNISLVVSGQQSNGVKLNIVALPIISSLEPEWGAYGDTVIINGAGFGQSAFYGKVLFGGVEAEVISWYDDYIETTFPLGSTSGEVLITKKDRPGNSVPYEVFGINSIYPLVALAGTEVKVYGTGFGAIQGDNYIAIAGTPIEPSAWFESSIRFSVPEGIQSGDLAVTIDDHPSNSFKFTTGLLALVQQTDSIEILFEAMMETSDGKNEVRSFLRRVGRPDIFEWNFTSFTGYEPDSVYLRSWDRIDGVMSTSGDVIDSATCYSYYWVYDTSRRLYEETISEFVIDGLPLTSVINDDSLKIAFEVSGSEVQDYIRNLRYFKQWRYGLNNPYSEISWELIDVDWDNTENPPYLKAVFRKSENWQKQ